jgi:putative hemolysin
MGWLLLGFLLYFLVLLSEQVLLSTTPHQMEQLKADGAAAARRALGIVRAPRPALAALLLARIFLKVLLAVFSIQWLHRVPFVREVLDQWTIYNNSALPGQIAFFLIMAFGLALAFQGFRRLSRWAWLQRHSMFWLRALSAYITFWRLMFAPLVRGEKVVEPEPVPVVPHVAGAPPVDHDTRAAAEKRDLELLKSIVKFSDVTVKQVMQPRNKVEAVDFRTPFDKLLEIARESGFSRLPVYDDDLDNATGILYVKDLVEYLDRDAGFEWQSLIRTNVLLVPEAKRISELLQEFKQNKMHMAIVVDEYGGSAGVVTMEDILEEVTGEISDEFDEESDIPFRKLDDFTFLFEGQTLLNDVCRITGLAPDTFDAVRGNADTLAGLALELKGDIPRTGAELAWNGYLLTITIADNRRIEQIKLGLPRQ